MSRYIQKRITRLLKNIKDTQRKKAYVKCQENIELLIQCLSSIGLEESKAVELLDSHYKLLFKVHTKQTNDKLLIGSLSKILTCEDLKLNQNEFEVAFIVHIASMSDSLESIYLAAKEDNNCVAHWIVVPYCEVKDYQIQNIMHFEGEGHYDERFDITPWKEYNLEAHRPDIIFTLNAYDANNTVTTIYHEFYSQTICNFTDLLVYVPYFIDIDTGLEENFALVPSCVFANKVTLATEKLREHYIDTYSKKYGNEFGKPEDKFVALGSPKYDKVINTKRDDYELPETWKTLVGEKKVITYISSVMSVLEKRDIYLNKLKTILDVFKSRDDVVLWWRPHPLIENTIKSMLPDMLESYQEIVAEFKNDDEGIFDDTSDLHRAIAWSDGYYGDRSSLIMLYQCVGKPVMIADTTSRTEQLRPVLDGCFFEGDSSKDTLESFINLVIKSNETDDRIFNKAVDIVNKDGTAGKAIFEYAKKCIGI